MKYLLIVALALASVSVSAQGIFKPPVKPSASSRIGAALPGAAVNNVHLISEVSATVDGGTQLAGGLGIALLHDKFSDATQTYITQWSVGAVAFLGTTGTQMTGTGGIIIGVPGTNGLIGVGAGRDFTQGRWVILTGIQFKFY